MQNTVNIRPDVQMLGLLRNYNYTTWHSLAEYVDNSVQSFLDSKNTLGDQKAVDVDIRLDKENKIIVIRDNAGGIHKDDFPRAFKTGTPPSTKDLNEFGVGMKVASCWWADKWKVKTKVRGENVAYEVAFDMEKIISDGIENLDITSFPEDAEKHYTEITLSELRQPFPTNGSTQKKIKGFLADTYQKFMKQGELNLSFAGDPLENFNKPKVLIAPYAPNGTPIDNRNLEWRVDLDINLGEGQTAKGHFMLLAEGEGHVKSGLRLYRNGRIIQGASEDTHAGYYPRGIFGGINSNERLRISGELVLEGFEVASSKDAVKWNNKKVLVDGQEKELDEETFCDLIKMAMVEQGGEVGEKFLKQARDIRMKETKKVVGKSFAQATQNAGDQIKRKEVEIASEIDVIETTSVTSDPLPETKVHEYRPVRLEHDGISWDIDIKTIESDNADWLEISNSIENENEISLEIQVSMFHPFMRKYVRNEEVAEGFLHMAASMAISETSAQRNDYADVSIIRETMNKLLKIIAT